MSRRYRVANGRLFRDPERRALPFPARFQFIEALGKGANAIVFLANDTSLHRQVAVKLYDRAGRRLSSLRDQALEEARKLAQLDDSRIARVFDTGVLAGLPYVVMEFITGKTVRDWLETSPILNDRCAAWYQIAEAMEKAHAVQAYHGDLHANNVLRTSTGSLKLIDFGTSMFSGVGASRARESRVLSECVFEMFPDGDRSLLEVSSWESVAPEMTLKGLTAWVQVNQELVEIQDLQNRRETESYDHHCRSRLLYIQPQLAEAPIFAVRAVVGRVRAILQDEPLIDFFMSGAVAECRRALTGNEGVYSVPDLRGEEAENILAELYGRCRTARGL